MSGIRMHADEIDIDVPLVVRLIAEQFPAWAALPVRKVRSAGTDNAMFRLGEELVVRLPRIPDAAGQVEKEQRWLPYLAPHLPLRVPAPLGRGVPAVGFPFAWSVYGWLDGEDAFGATLADPGRAAAELGRFVAALRRVEAAGGPPSFRGGPVSGLDDYVRAAIRDLGADQAAVTAAWEEVLGLPQWEDAPVWVHSDLLPGNLLLERGRLSAVIDFGAVGVGDPACDMLAAWTLLGADTRGRFRECAEVDEATWARGRGWALAWGLVADHHYRATNPVLATVGRRAVTEALVDRRV
ncbi:MULTISPECIES: aminoglycoside phosphotransferase family protein [unclassified Kitasatospora]|uniref:aminoglycoside phosphotransferase family protein n=1 Tax=unclassified Kitasatospora TaxID=2633591 RepID=UPI00070A8B9D|nr:MULTISPECIES: aminoglycoside phosphotransferase family protein [unclassified Kitasatospora]KQV14852.1 phosphotransferase [Kitasatospora sp. Root107]KRB68207.1 phosphotransferase [Kitasatospora sp. Root187]